MQKKIEKKFFVFEIIASELIALNCCFPKNSLKLDLLGLDLARFFCVRNFGNTSAMRVIFF